LKWIIAVISALILISSFLVLPFRIYPEWQILSKAYACSRSVRIINKLGYMVLLGESEDGKLVTRCAFNDRRIHYCLFIPGTQPPKYLAVVGKP